MSKRKLQKYCQLSQAIKAYDAEFYYALDDLCLLPLLRSGPNGITFLYPEDKKVRHHIINATYSKSPEEAITAVKALILRGYHDNPANTHNGVNLLNQLVDTSSGKWGNFTVSKKDDKFFGHRSRISIFHLAGNSQIPIHGKEVARENLPPRASRRNQQGEGEVVGGGIFGKWDCDCDCWPSHRVSLAKKLAKVYPSEKNKKSNVYVKKVALQLDYLEKHYPEIYNSQKLIMHLGNEEISDSYLLDMITPDDCFCKLWQVFGKNKNGLGEVSEDKYKGGVSFYEYYKQRKNNAITKTSQYRDQQTVVAELTKNLAEQKRLLNNVVAVCDIREALIGAYRNKTLLGKDLFIVFTSVMKEMWEHEFDMESFEHYSYMATHVYTSCEDMVNQEFNQFKDATLHGNLLKSDVFKFIPWTEPGIYASVGYKGTHPYPKPIDLQIYSLNGLIAGITDKKTGGARSVLEEFF